MRYPLGALPCLPSWAAQTLLPLTSHHNDARIRRGVAGADAAGGAVSEALEFKVRQRLHAQRTALVRSPALWSGPALLFGDNEAVGRQIRKDDGEDLRDGRDVAGQREVDGRN